MITETTAATLLYAAPDLLVVAILLGFAAAGAATLARALVGAFSVDRLLVKPWSCDLCLSSYGCAAGGIALGIVLWPFLGWWSVQAALLVAGAALMLAVLVLKLKTRLET